MHSLKKIIYTKKQGALKSPKTGDYRDTIKLKTGNGSILILKT